MIKQAVGLTAVLAVLAAVAVAMGGGGGDDREPKGDVERGGYIVNAFGCIDCHTPVKMGPSGPEPDMTMNLAGHPESLVLPPAPVLPPGPWVATISGSMTAWSGPWGTSFTANLTPDPETGLGKWTSRDFIETMRSGRHLGRGREILPPMPWKMIRNLTDEDLRNVFAYLQSVEPVKNRVPQPIPPIEAR